MQSLSYVSLAVYTSALIVIPRLFVFLVTKRRITSWTVPPTSVNLVTSHNVWIVVQQLNV